MLKLHRPPPAISAATEKNTRDALHSHVQQLSDFTLESSRYGGHGHAEGKQGSRGHTMPPSDAHMQRDGDRIIPQGGFCKGSAIDGHEGGRRGLRRPEPE